MTLSTLTKHPNFIKYIGDAVTTTLKSIVYAPVHSPISEINMENIIKFMVTLCEMSRQVRNFLFWKKNVKILTAGT